MDDRQRELRELTDDLTDHPAVEDAWLAKSFTDRLVVLDVDGEVPDGVREALADHDCYGANEVYELDDADGSYVGDVGDDQRHQFVDVRTRGDHQSYVVE